MAFLGSLWHSVLIYLPHLLAAAAFPVMLAGVIIVQDECSSVNASDIQAMGANNYLAPVPCNRLFSFDWFITFWHGFVVLLLFFIIVTRIVHKARYLSNGLLITTALLGMFMAHTWYMAWTDLELGYGRFGRGAKTLFAGALAAAISSLLLIMTIGLHDENTPVERRRGGIGRKGRDDPGRFDYAQRYGSY